MSGTLGDAAGALRLWQQGALSIATATLLADYESLRLRLLRPTPRVTLGLRLRAFAHAAVDVSDGLLADLGHIATRSNVAAHVDADSLPISHALRELLGREAARDCALRGATTTSCASPPPPTSATRCTTWPNRWTCRSPASAVLPKGRAYTWTAKPPTAATSTSRSSSGTALLGQRSGWAQIPLRRKGSDPK